MKKVLSVVLILGLMLGLAGCKREKDRLLYKKGLEDYITLGSYKGITIDTKSEEFDEAGTAYILNDVISNGFHSTKAVKKGEVKLGDIANIDYVGTKDGVAFEGGTAKGYDLTIGSGNFIAGFEEGLIGKKIGDTVKLDLTFPENYQSADLAGADVVFTVTINSVKAAKTPEEFCTALGFVNADAYYENVKNAVIEEILFAKVFEKCDIKEYPQDDLELLFNHYYNMEVKNIEYYYQCTLAQYLAQYGMTEDDYKSNFKEQIVKPLMQQQMVWYAILDKEEMTFDEKDTEQKIKDIIARDGDSSVKRADVIETYGEFYIESLVVSDKVLKFLKDNAKIS